MEGKPKTPFLKINVEESIFLCCDPQQSFSKLIYAFDTIVGAGKQLIKTAAVLGIPVLATEQNPERLGHIVQEISKEMPSNHSATFSKLSFSMVNAETKEFLGRYPHRKTAILFGGETHVCILQTFQDLVELGYTVCLVTDGISSVRRLDRTTAFRRMEAQGAILTTSESIIFELIRVATHPEFKKILQIIKMDRINALAKL